MLDCQTFTEFNMSQLECSNLEMNDQIQNEIFYLWGEISYLNCRGKSSIECCSFFILINVAYNIECLDLDCIDWKLIVVHHKASKLNIDLQMVSSNPGGFLIVRRRLYG